MYIFLSGDKLCCKISQPDSRILSFIIPSQWKESIFGEKWSIRISELTNQQKLTPEIRKLLDLRKEQLIIKPEFVEKPMCENCNIPLNDSGQCPICDDGEEDY